MNMTVNVSSSFKLSSLKLYMVLTLEITIDNLETPMRKVNKRCNLRKSIFCYRRLSRRSGVLSRKKNGRHMRRTIRNNNAVMRIP